MVPGIGVALGPVVGRRAGGHHSVPNGLVGVYRKKTEPGGFVLLLDQGQTLAGPHCLPSPRPVSPCAVLRALMYAVSCAPVCPVGIIVGLQQVRYPLCPHKVVFVYLLSKQETVCVVVTATDRLWGPALGFELRLLRSEALTLGEVLPCPVPQFPLL